MMNRQLSLPAKSIQHYTYILRDKHQLSNVSDSSGFAGEESLLLTSHSTNKELTEEHTESV